MFTVWFCIPCVFVVVFVYELVGAVAFFLLLSFISPSSAYELKAPSAIESLSMSEWEVS